MTLLGAEAPHSAMSMPDPARDDNPDRIVLALAAALASPATNPALLRRGMNAVILNPDHADVLARAGLTRRDVQLALFERAGNRRGELRRYGGGLVPDGPDDEWLPVVRAPDDLVVLVAGGAACTRWSFRPGVEAPTGTSPSRSRSARRRLARWRCPNDRKNLTLYVQKALALESAASRGGRPTSAQVRGGACS